MNGLLTFVLLDQYTNKGLEISSYVGVIMLKLIEADGRVEGYHILTPTGLVPWHADAEALKRIATDI